MNQTVHIDFFPFCYLSLDEDNNLLSVNKRCLIMLEQQYEDVIGRKFTDFVSGNSINDFWKLHELAEKGHDNIHARLILVQKSGSSFEVSINVQIERKKSGQIVCMHCFIEGIKDSKAVWGHDDYEQQFRNLYERSSIGIAILAQDFSILECNKAFKDLAASCVKKRGDKNLKELIHHEDFVSSYKKLEKLRNNECTSIELEMRFIGKRMRAIYGFVTVNTVLASDGQPLYFIMQVIDFTARILVEQKLKKSKERFSSIFEGVNEGMIFVDQYGIVNEVNTTLCKLTGIDKEELLGRSALYLAKKFLAGIDFKSVSKIIHTTLRGKANNRFELDYRDKIFEVSTQGIAYTKGVVGIIRDITHEKRLLDQLKNSQDQFRNLANYLQNIREKERTSIAREIHDELGQLLTALKMDISLLKTKSLGEDEDVNNLIDGMLKLASASLKSVKDLSTRLRPGLLDDLGLEAAIEWQTDEIRQRSDIEIELFIDLKELKISNYVSTVLFRIYQEALTNVLRHSKASKVWAKLLLNENNHIVLEVIDNGIGIDKSKIKDPGAYGILGMSERTMSCLGTMEIYGEKRKGTTLKVSIPVKNH